MIQEEEDKLKNSNFKASDFNRKILYQVSNLPSVERRPVTSFNEFNLSKPCIADKENENEPMMPTFKARELNKKILQEATFKPEINNQ